MKITKVIILFLVLGLSVSMITLSGFADCTITMVGKEATKDGSTMVSVSQDRPDFHYTLEYIPPKDHVAGTMKKIYDFPTTFRWWDEYGKPIDATAEDKIVANCNGRNDR